MPNAGSHPRDVNLNHSEIPHHVKQNGSDKKQITNTGEGVEKSEPPSHTAGGGYSGASTLEKNGLAVL